MIEAVSVNEGPEGETRGVGRSLTRAGGNAAGLADGFCRYAAGQVTIRAMSRCPPACARIHTQDWADTGERLLTR